MNIYTNGNPQTKTGYNPAGAQAPDDALVTAIVNQVVAGLKPVSEPAQPARPAPLSNSLVSSFWSELDRLVSSNTELRAALEGAAAKSAAQALVASGAAAPSAEDFSSLLSKGVFSAKGGTVVRTFWWGFHIQISHEDLQSFLATAAGVNTIVATIGGGIPSPAQPWIALAAAFVAGALALLKGLDHGNGVYISMSWFAPGAFVPTSV